MLRDCAEGVGAPTNSPQKRRGEVLRGRMTLADQFPYSRVSRSEREIYGETVWWAFLEYTNALAFAAWRRGIRRKVPEFPHLYR